MIKSDLIKEIVQLSNILNTGIKDRSKTTSYYDQLLSCMTIQNIEKQDGISFMNKDDILDMLKTVT